MRYNMRASDKYWCVQVTYILACQYSVHMVLVSVCDCGLPVAPFQVQFRVLV